MLPGRVRAGTFERRGKPLRERTSYLHNLCGWESGHQTVPRGLPRSSLQREEAPALGQSPGCHDLHVGQPRGVTMYRWDNSRCAAISTKDNPRGYTISTRDNPRGVTMYTWDNPRGATISTWDNPGVSQSPCGTIPGVAPFARPLAFVLLLTLFVSLLEVDSQMRPCHLFVTVRLKRICHCGHQCANLSLVSQFTNL
jgi:hypothetical protein